MRAPVTATPSNDDLTSAITSPAARSWRPRWLPVVGVAAVVTTALTVWLGLWVTPPDQVQGNLARLLYIHPAVATVALYWAGGVALVGSVLYLWPRTRSFFWDRLAASAVEVGAVFSALTLITGSLWGRPVWGVWWAWDARLVTTAVLFFLYIGYLALRRVPAPLDARAKRCAVAALVAFVDVPIVHFSVDWWRTLHQQATVFTPSLNAHIHGVMAFTLWWGVLAFTLLFVFLLDKRYRLETLEEDLEAKELAQAIEERVRGAGTTAAPEHAEVGAGR